MANPKLSRFQKKLLKAKIIGIDSMVFIYQFADHPRYAPLTDVVFRLLEEKRIVAVTSTISVIEVLAKPEQEKNRELLHDYEKVFLHYPQLEVVAIDWHVARLAARLRASYRTIKIPDALQLAVALLKECPVFISNDSQLQQVKGLEVILLDKYL